MRKRRYAKLRTEFVGHADEDITNSIYTQVSLEQLSKTYAHLLPDSAERAKMALDMYLSEAAETAEGGQQ